MSSYSRHEEIIARFVARKNETPYLGQKIDNLVEQIQGDLKERHDNYIMQHIRIRVHRCFFVSIKNVQEIKIDNPRPVTMYRIYFSIIDHIDENPKKIRKINTNNLKVIKGTSRSDPGVCKGICIAELRMSRIAISSEVIMKNVSFDFDREELISIFKTKFQ